MSDEILSHEYRSTTAGDKYRHKHSRKIYEVVVAARMQSSGLAVVVYRPLEDMANVLVRPLGEFSSNFERV